MINMGKNAANIRLHEITSKLLIPVTENTPGTWHYTFFLCLIFFFFFLPFKHELNSANNSISHILILHSYNQGLRWTDNEDRGIRSVFSNRLFEIELHTEYMNTKLIADEKYFSSLYNILKMKYSSLNLSAVIVTDDDAFNFYIKYHKTLFPGIPMFFCGVNYLIDLEKYGYHSYVTGVVEAFDIKNTLSAALKLHPGTERVVVINDRTTTGIANRKVIEELIPEFSDRVSFTFFEDFTMEELLPEVKNLSKGDIVLLMTFNRDKSGEVFSYDRSITLISGAASIPVYGVWDFYLGMGITGGMLTSGYDQGRIAGEMALRYIDGEKIADIPVIRESPNRYMFDYNYLSRFDINMRDLPENSLIINEPLSFYELNKNLVWVMVAGLFMLSTIIILMMRNMQQQRISAENLRISEERFRTLLDNLNVGVYRCTSGPQGRFLQANPAMLKFFDYDSMDDFMKLPVSELYYYPESRQIFVDEVTCKRSINDKELLMRKKDGSPVWVSINAKGQFDSTGELKWLDCVLEDITERKKLEEQLRQSQKMEALGTLAGGVAHDFNNILTAIVGFGGMLRMRIADDAVLCSYADEILSAANQATGLTKSLLAFSRKQLLSSRVIDANEIIRSIEKLLGRIIGEDIIFTINLCREPMTISADNSQLEQVILNLATNARDAMPDGGTLSIKTEKIELHESITNQISLDPGNYIQISVTDTGKGISREVKERIFEPFFTTKDMGKGTGLGLSIVYGIVKQHNGEITLYSEENEGTTIKIFLPLVDLPAETVKPETMPESAGGSETILIAEDDASVRLFLKSFLEEYGYTIIEACDGAEAVEEFLHNIDRIDLIILDVVMPKLNGKEAYDVMSEMKAGIPVLFSSGYTAEIIHSKGVVEKELNFISKPFSSQALLSKVRQILSPENR